MFPQMTRIIIFMACIMLALTASAKKSEGVDALFDGRYNSDPTATVTIVRGGMESHGLDVYKSISLEKADAEDIASMEKAVLEEAHNIDNRKMIFTGGKLYFAFLDLSTRGRGKYVYYLNKQPKGGRKVILIYMEGKADVEEVKKLLHINE